MIEVKDLSCLIDDREIISGVSFEVKAGEVIGVLGSNGAGKTTLLRCLLGLEKYQGSVSFELKSGEKLSPIASGKKKLAQHIAWVPQNFNLDSRITVEDYLKRARYAYHGKSQSDAESSQKAIARAVETTGIGSLRTRLLPAMSGGEKRLVLLAAALVQEPEILLVDEPGSSLDVVNQTALFNLIDAYSEEWGLTVIVVGHEVNLTSKISDRILGLEEGKLVCFKEPTQAISKDNLRRIFNADFELIDTKGQDFPLAICNG